MTDDKLIKNRFDELALRSLNRGCYSYTEFLSLAEQDILCSMKLSAPMKLFGGFPDAERKIACFGSAELCGYEEAWPICCLCIAPSAQKFADELTHRDFLGALMGLGIRREVLGDIVIKENKGHLFCLESIAEYISDNFSQVKRTAVTIKRIDESSVTAAELPDLSQIVVASERLDAIISSVYKISRAESQRLVEQEKVFINSRGVQRATCSPVSGDVISVRGYGRFIYDGMERETRKGRLRVNVRML